MKAIKSGVLFVNDEFIEGYVLVFDEKIMDLVSEDCFEKYQTDVSEVIDAKGCYVLPGFIDTHIHGYGGRDVMDNNKQSILEIKQAIVKNGVTSFLPTTLTADICELESVLNIVREVKENEKAGAKILGVHLEGPYINIEKKGAQNEKFVALPNVDFVEQNKDILKVITLAPEIDGALDLIKKFSENINFQVGHTMATFEEANNAIKAGAKGFTHTFNAMTGIHHRDLGAAGACLMSDDTYAEMICDNIHLTKDLYNFIIKNKGVEKVVLVTDCMCAGGLKDGEYNLGGLKTIVKEGACRLEDGTLAGSVLDLNHALKNVVENSNKNLEECVKMVTINQATYLGLENIIGKLNKGYRSDIVIMNNNYEIQKTFVDGECVYEI